MLEHIDQATASKELSSIAGVSEFEVRGVSEDDLSVAATISNINAHSTNNKLELYSPRNSAGGGSSKGGGVSSKGQQRGHQANMENIIRGFK